MSIATTDICKDCRFWQQGQDGFGICRRYPPTDPKTADARWPSWRYPITEMNYWCGEFEQKPLEYPW